MASVVRQADERRPELRELSERLPSDPVMSNFLGVALLTISALVPLGAARAVLGVILALLARSNMPR